MDEEARDALDDYLALRMSANFPSFDEYDIDLGHDLGPDEPEEDPGTEWGAKRYVLSVCCGSIPEWYLKGTTTRLVI